MDENKSVNDSLILLQQMIENPEIVMRELDPTERDGVVKNLRALENQAAGVQTDTNLLALADGVNRLVEETPALADLLLPEGTDAGTAQKAREREISLRYHEETSLKTSYAQEHAAQIRNHVVECRRTFERWLQVSSEDERRQ